MTIELSTTTKVLVLIGLLLAAGGTGTLLIAHNRSTSTPPSTVALTTTPSGSRTSHRSVPATRHAAPAVHLTVGLPAPLRSALATNRLVVAVVYAPGDAVDAEVFAAARQGAATENAPIVGLNIHSDTVATATATWMNKVVEPAVLVVTRPGNIVVELDGYTDGPSVAQAIADARR